MRGHPLTESLIVNGTKQNGLSMDRKIWFKQCSTKNP